MQSPIYIQISSSRPPSPNYEHALQSAGAVPVSDYAPAPAAHCHGLVLSGGGDIDPAHFRQENRGSNLTDPVRDAAELALFWAYFRAGKPILGICRGMQLINVALGGTLIQDLPAQIRGTHVAQHGDAVHPIRAAREGFLGGLHGENFAVNSAHHQAVDRLGTGLRAVAWAQGDVVEAIEYGMLPIWGVQFHPERMSYENKRADTIDGAALLERWVQRCGGLA